LAGANGPRIIEHTQQSKNAKCNEQNILET
jgi:hypothetical protein